METIGYRRAQTQNLVEAPAHRPWCPRCRRPLVCCYCAQIEPFDSEPRFVILTQPREAKHRLGTARMAHLCLKNSLLLEGVDFTHDARVNRDIHDPANFPVLLYPRAGSVRLSGLTRPERAALIPRRLRPVVFVLDGTWKSVRKMIRLSKNLSVLPAICFDPPTPSAYGFRREPRPECYSTIEAIHQVIELFAPSEGVSRAQPRRHDNLLSVFRSMVVQQLTYSLPR